jgi:glycerophosphoryl diester phosphodiesterase
MQFFDQFSKKQLIAAHRGYRACYPENTLCALEAARGRCDFIEIDVRLSRDGVPVVIHDADLYRTSNGEEVAGRLDKHSLAVADWSLAQLQSLDMGSWFLVKDPFGCLQQGTITPEELCPHLPQPILTLQELLAWTKRNRIPVNVEIKDCGGDAALVVDPMLGVINQADCIQQILISSFQHDYLARIRQLSQDLALAALFEGAPPAGLINYLQQLTVCAYHCDPAGVSRELVDSCTKEGITTCVYTINDRQQQEQLFAMGVRAVFADFL